MRMSLYVVLITLLINFSEFESEPKNLLPENRQGAAERVPQPKNVCGYDVIQGGFAAARRIKDDKEAKLIYSRVMVIAGLDPDTIEVLPANVKEQYAYSCEDPLGGGGIKRYILFDPSFLNRLIESNGTDWAALAIFAHEVGHFKKSHALKLRRECMADLELEADEVAGEIMVKMGASLEEVKAVFSKIQPKDGNGCYYPPLVKRHLAVERGWRSNTPYTWRADKKHFQVYDHENNISEDCKTNYWSGNNLIVICGDSKAYTLENFNENKDSRLRPAIMKSFPILASMKNRDAALALWRANEDHYALYANGEEVNVSSNEYSKYWDGDNKIVIHLGTSRVYTLRNCRTINDNQLRRTYGVTEDAFWKASQTGYSFYINGELVKTTYSWDGDNLIVVHEKTNKAYVLKNYNKCLDGTLRWAALKP